MNDAVARLSFKPEQIKERIHIIGCGSIGSTLAVGLAHDGFRRFTLYDFDKVEEHNLKNQSFDYADIGQNKAEALMRHVLAINPFADVAAVKEGYLEQRLSGYIFLAVDKLEVRQKIVTENLGNGTVKAIFDFRTSLESAQIFAADWSNYKHRQFLKKSLGFSKKQVQEAAPELKACHAPGCMYQIITRIVSDGIAGFVQMVRHQPFYNYQEADPFEVWHTKMQI